MCDPGGLGVFKDSLVVLSACLGLTLVLFPALQVAFGSLYRDDVLIKPSRVVALLAAACMLQLVSNKCAVFVCFLFRYR